MPSNNFKSPYATSFNNCINRGVPCLIAVQGIAKRNNKTTNQVFESLHKAGCCYRQKFNGTWLYWPCEGSKTTSTNWKKAQINCWQNFVDWCICSGTCTPEQLWNNCGSQNNFMSYCKKFWGKQYTTTTGSKTTTKRTDGRNINSKSNTTRNYKFSGRTTRKAA